MFGLDNLVPESCQMLVVEPKPDLERAIGQPLLTLEQVEHLGQDLVKRLDHPASQLEGVRDTARSCSHTPYDRSIIDGRDVFVHARVENHERQGTS